jgi:Lrp/AsnC family leucine-responsive transcriptional regulator
MTFVSTPGVDNTDWGIVEALQQDARLTWAELGRRVNLSPPAVAERVRRLEEQGVIKGYRAEVDLARLGLPMQAVIRIVTSNAAECNNLGGRLKEVPEVLECYRVTGSDSYVVRVALRSMEHLEELLERVAPTYGDTITAMVLSTPVASKPVGRNLVIPD